MYIASFRTSPGLWTDYSDYWAVWQEQVSPTATGHPEGREEVVAGKGLASLCRQDTNRCMRQRSYDTA